MGKRYFECVEGTSSKFWEVHVSGKNVITRYGRIGAEGQETSKPFPSPAQATSAAARLIGEKTRKGYLERSRASSQPAMTLDGFWALVDQVRTETKTDAAFLKTLRKRLTMLRSGDVVAFQKHLNGRYAAAGREKLWAAAYLLNRGCSDDGFDYFRAWLVSRGRKVFEAAVKDPDSLVDVDGKERELEELMSVAPEVYETMTGEEMPESLMYGSGAGGVDVTWDFDDAALMKKKLPRIFAKYGSAVEKESPRTGPGRSRTQARALAERLDGFRASPHGDNISFAYLIERIGPPKPEELPQLRAFIQERPDLTISVRGKGYEKLDWLRELPEIERLHWFSRKPMASLEPLRALNRLKYLHLGHEPGETTPDLRPLAAQKDSLRELVINGSVFENLAQTLPQLEKLQRLTLRDLRLPNLACLHGLPLTHLAIEDCRIPQLDAVGEIRTLRQLRLGPLPELREAHFLTTLVNLERLELELLLLERLPPLPKLTKLKKVVAWECDELGDVWIGPKGVSHKIVR